MAQESEACQFLFAQDNHSNSESLASVVGMGRKARLICPLTNDPEHIRESVLKLQSDSLYPIEPSAFLTAIQIALLSLRHRPTQTMAPSIVAFVYSPLELSVDKEDMTNLGRELSSEAIDITLYVFGEHAQANAQLLQYLVDASAAGSNRINATVTHINGNSLYDFVNSYVQTLMLGNMATGYINYDDDEDDIELQLALQLSRQEAEEAARRNQQGSAEHEDAVDAEAPAPPSTNTSSAPTTFKGADAQPSIFGIEREDRLGPTQDENSINSDDLAKDLDAMDDSDPK